MSRLHPPGTASHENTGTEHGTDRATDPFASKRNTTRSMGVGTGDVVWRRRGVLILKWALIAAAGFFGVLILERLAVML